MRTSTLLLVALAPAACSSSKPAEKKPTASGPADAGAGEVAERIASTGPLAEAEFKALHELRTDAPPVVHGEMIDLAGSKAYLSLPQGKTGPFPGIVVIHEWWGLNANIQHWADRLAGLGYAALAVDLYNGAVATTPDEAMAAMKNVNEADARRILAAAVDFLGSDPRIQAPRRGVIGWCFGGGWSLQAAIDHPQLDAAVMYYGRPDTDPAHLRRIHAHLMAIWGNRDQSLPPDAVNGFEKAVKQAGVVAEFHRYDAEHAFANPSGPHYQEQAATDAWKQVARFLGENLSVH
ncbi:MAG TPA: dienelactone hydrolase family protein [Kofleriaceae bacterium]|nr:dienelactone hydrolase family protein [Kofleriaceae bacterium]